MHGFKIDLTGVIWKEEMADTCREEFSLGGPYALIGDRQTPTQKQCVCYLQNPTTSLRRKKELHQLIQVGGLWGEQSQAAVMWEKKGVIDSFYLQCPHPDKEVSQGSSSTCWFQLKDNYSLTYTLRPREGLIILLSLTQGRSCHSHGSEVLGL